MNLEECKNCDYPDNDNYTDCCNTDCEVYRDMQADMKMDDYRNSPEYKEYENLPEAE